MKARITWPFGGTRPEAVKLANSPTANLIR